MKQEAQNPVEQKQGPEVGEMRKGDYMIHVFLQEGKQFKYGNANTVSPMIEISCCGKKKYSQSKSNVGTTSSVYWGEHLFFEPKNLSKNEIETAQINIRVLNKGLLKDDLIGSYDFDITYVYFQNKHAVFHQWIAMSNIEGTDFNEITCYFKLSISIQGPGDEQVSLNESNEIEKTDDQMIMMPPSIKKEFKQIKLRFIKGEKFPKMDQFGTIDAYIQATFFKKKLRTKTVTQSKNTDETIIEQEFWLPIQWPMASDRLVLKLFDEDKLKDEVVGSLNFSLKRIITELKEEGLLVWRNLYGSPLDCSGENTDKMNDYPELASTWKGRILMHLSAYDTKNPEMKVVPLDPQFKQRVMELKAYDLNEYEILAEVGAGVCLPGKKNYTIRIQINDFFIDTKAPKEAKANYCRWSERFPVTSFKGPYKSLQELNRIYIYLMDGNDAICFWQGLVSDFLDPNPQYRWLPLTCDLAKGKVKNAYEAGLIQVKISVNHKTKNGTFDFMKEPSWKKPPPKRLRSWKIRCFIFQCKDIPSADSDGTSDPYITLWNQDNKEIKTQVIEDNINPIFFEALELFYDFDNINDAPPVVLNIWDKDEGVLDADDYLGRCVVYLTDAAISNDDSIPEPKWHDIRVGFKETDPPCGQMLLSFSLVEDDFTYKIPINYLKLTEQIEYKDFSVEINVLGLRNLESFGLMPVKKPFIKFNLRSLLPPEKAQAVTNIKTLPSSSGNNPNINTIISFQVDLPVNPLFCPKLQCDVYDYVYKGLVQPLLGTFTLSIGDIMHQQKLDREAQLRVSEDIINHLKTKIKQASEEIKESEELQDYEKEQLFEQRVQGFGQIAEEQTIETSRVISEQDKERLISGPLQQEKSAFEEQKEEIEEIIVEAPVEEQKKEQSPSLQRGPTLKKKGGVFQSPEKQLQEDLKQGINYKLMIQKEVSKVEHAQQRAVQREHDQKALQEQTDEFHKNVIFPNYEFDERLKIRREVNKPPNSLFIELGHNEQPPQNIEEEKKHYRKYFEDELENNKDIFPVMPFLQSDIIRGQSRGLNKGLFSFFSKPTTDESGMVTNQKTVGYFKGRINIENKEESDDFKITRQSRIKIILDLLNDLSYKRLEQPLEFQMKDLESYEKTKKFEAFLEKIDCTKVKLLEFLKEQSYFEMISRQLLSKTRCIIRVYVIEGYDFAQRDIGSASDPYLKLKCGKKKYSERDNYQLDQPNPKFYKMYEFDAEFPGAAPLVIKAYDYDDLFGDDLIGKTSIDLDDRFFSPQWQQIEQKPIEYRQIYHPSSQNSQGVIKLWLEIHTTNISTKVSEQIWDITPLPERNFELRVVVWDTLDVPNQDVEGTSDVFVKVFLDDKDKKETDTHFRSTNQKASFNYRLLYNVLAPRSHYNLTLQVWDRDLFKSNDFIGETQFSLKELFEDAIATKKPITLNKKYYQGYLKQKMGDLKMQFYDDDSFYVETYDKDGNYAGKARISINVTPEDMAKANPVGIGRTEPNHSPFLPPPVGRLQLSLNPIKMLLQMVGPELRRKIYLYLCLGLCALLCIACIPMIFSELITQAILKVF